MNSCQQILEIKEHFPELRVSPTETGFTWEFRCLTSEDYSQSEFSSPVAAVAHFAQVIVEQDDKFLAAVMSAGEEGESEFFE